jgi:H+/gluconate symporter-like permease
MAAAVVGVLLMLPQAQAVVAAVVRVALVLEQVLEQRERQTQVVVVVREDTAQLLD